VWLAHKTPGTKETDLIHLGRVRGPFFLLGVSPKPPLLDHWVHGVQLGMESSSRCMLIAAQNVVLRR
jgi:hypothetical protein